MRIGIILVALFGLSSVVIGAVIEHVGGNYSAELLNAARTGIRYHQLYVPILLALVLYQDFMREENKLLFFSVLLLGSGAFLFSSSLYIYFLTGVKMVTYLTPVGGVLMVSGWGALAVYGYYKRG